jgi:PKD repeat protein
LLLVGLAVFASVASALGDPPAASFTVSKSVAQPGEPMTFDATTSAAASDERKDAIASYAWEFSDDGETSSPPDDASGPAATHAFATAGTHTVTLRVTDAEGDYNESTKPVAVNAPPTASFTYGAPVQGSPTSFSGSFTDADGDSIASWQWTFSDSDGPIGTRSGQNTNFTFPNFGFYTVKLEITDSRGGVDSEQRTIYVSNRAPIASFNFFPQAPVAGDTLYFTSTSWDPDGPLASQDWDLDADGQYDDASGPTATRIFATAGAYVVWLRVRDRDLAQDEEFQSFNVAPKTAALVRPLLLSPFPRVGLRGKLVRGGTKITVLSIELPRGSIVTVRCRGSSCPFKAKSQTAARRRVRITGFSRVLRAGVVIQIFVEKANRIGKYTRFKMRAGKTPLRKDACLRPGSKRPRRCPS